MLKSTSKLSRSILLATTLLSACGKPGADLDQVHAPVMASNGAVANSQAVDQSPITVEMNKDTEQLLQLVSMGPVSPQEADALASAKEKIALVKDAQATAEQEKKTAFEAKAAYAAQLKIYQQAQAEVDSAGQTGDKAAAAFMAARKDLANAKAALKAATDSYHSINAEPRSTEEQKAAAIAAVAKAKARVEQTYELAKVRNSELVSLEENYPLQQSSVEIAAEHATQAGTEYAHKATIAVQAASAVNAAVAEEKKAMALIFTLNRAKAKAVAEALVEAVHAQNRTRWALSSAQEAAKTASAANQSAASRLSTATKEDSNARNAAEAAEENAPKAAAAAQEKAEAKVHADSIAAAALSVYNDAKAIYEEVAATANKSSAAAKLAAKSLASANWRVKSTGNNRNAAAQLVQTKDSPEAQKLLADAQIAAELAVQGQKDAQDKATAADAQAAIDAAAVVDPKADADAKLAIYRQAASVASAAAKEKAVADSNSRAATTAVEKTTASAAARASELVKATAAAEAASQASYAANEKLNAATEAEANARAHYKEIYTNNEIYQLSPTKTEEEELAENKKLYAAALWANVPDGNYWTTLVVASIRQNIANLEKAKDINSWCPGYNSASDHHREVCWLRILGGLVKFESSFKPSDAFEEPKKPGDKRKEPVWSVGLMALSPNECKGSESVPLLKQPLLNLNCGINKFANLVARDGMIDGPVEARGAAAYWSVLRTPYKQAKPKERGGGYFNLGKKDQITPFSSEYRKY